MMYLTVGIPEHTSSQLVIQQNPMNSERDELDDDEPYLEVISKEEFIEQLEEASNQDEEE